MDQKEDNHSRNACAEVCLGLVVYLAFAVSFGILTNDESRYHPCSTTSSTYQWSRITLIFLIIGTCFSVVVSPLFRVCIMKMKDSSAGVAALLSTLLLICLLALAVFSLVCYGGLCYAYGENENCGDLNSLILAYIILVSIGLGSGAVGCCIGVCVMCCMGGAALLSKGAGPAEVVVQQQTGATESNRENNAVPDVEQQKAAGDGVENNN